MTCTPSYPKADFGELKTRYFYSSPSVPGTLCLTGWLQIETQFTSPEKQFFPFVTPFPFHKNNAAVKTNMELAEIQYDAVQSGRLNNVESLYFKRSHSVEMCNFSLKNL